MREIKFRVIRGKRVIAYEQFDMSMGWTHLVCDEPVSEDGSHWVHTGTYPDEFGSRGERDQSTGLRDRNGVEIFEGDILRIEGVENGSVEWSDSHGAFVCLDHILGTTSYEGFRKVIGNIHENPELLDG